jgi:Carboxypeptidase regulatory-like domain/Peptidase family M1 domain
VNLSQRRFSLSQLLALVAVFLSFASVLPADTISGSVKDPSGALVAGAQIEISGGALATPVSLTSDSNGNFTAPDLAPGKYSVRVTRDGFEPAVQAVDLRGTATLQVGLIILPQQTNVTVPGKSLAFANSDPAYRQLRDIGLGETVPVEDFTINVDVGTFQFIRGTITYLAPVNGVETGAIFVGRGHFTLKPVDVIDAHELARRSGAPVLEEDFTEVVFRFTPRLATRFPALSGKKVEAPPEAAPALKDWKERVRHRHEFPDGRTQLLLEGETMDNVDADVLAAIYTPTHPDFFNAYIHGEKNKDLRYFVRLRVGAMPELLSSEEVALINCAGQGMDDGIWYSSHLKGEMLGGTADAREDRRLFATHSYKIETVIARNDHLFARATIAFEPLLPGERVMKFGLLPNLRAVRVTDQAGQDLYFIQESRKEDGSFYVVLDKAPEMKKEHSINVEYEGDKVLYNAGNGTYYVGARESWYPNLNGFGEKALYDLTFKVAHNNKVISVGKLQGESTEEGYAVTHWVTPTPVAVAGFNIGNYKKMEMPDDITHYNITGYYLEDLPDSLKPFTSQMALPNPNASPGQSPLDSMHPASMAKYALEQTRAQMQICTEYFGRAPYEDIYITEQPDFNFGQSWPNLVYLPISAYIDSTERWMLFGQIDTKFTGFVKEVTPHEVSHQWWGHGVGWASYHDQWLSEGFAEFSAGLFLQQAFGDKWQKDYIDFWEQLRTRILEKDNFGVSPDDAGPIWLGERLISPRSENAYQNLVYPKGAYILQMLRSLMYADQSADQDKEKDFKAMMHDFVDSHRVAMASTESFKAIAEKHMTKRMDLQGNGRLDWFFNEWVYGTMVPRYSFHYEVQPASVGVRVHVEITQSEVDPTFAMFVPVFADFGKGMMRLGQVGIVGNSTRTVDFDLPVKPQKVALNAYKDILDR